MTATMLYSELKWFAPLMSPFVGFRHKLPRFFVQAFKPGIVDMTEEQLAVNKNAITLQGNDLDILLPDLDWYKYLTSHCQRRR
jgi:hypothetical protein